MENSDEHLFLTGKAGTGKSTLLNYFRETTKKKVVILAPTGIAAINVKGQTIHSFFGFPPHPLRSDQIRKRRNRKLYENLDTIIIDEVSMVRADLLDSINHFMRINGQYRYKAFGGVQMIFIGDLFQLPPVISSDEEKRLFDFMYDTPYFFSAQALHGLDLKYIELQKVYRQKDRYFLNLLDNVRVNTVDTHTLKLLNNQCQPYFIPESDDFYINLCSTNYIADRINRGKLQQLKTPVYQYQGEITGDFNRKWLPNSELLSFKVGAQVMFVRNDPDGHWVNGTLGRIHQLAEESITVAITTEDGEEQHHTVVQDTWEIRKYIYNEEKKSIDVEVIGSFTQYPVKLAWAITIHKSQGKTFDKVIINLGSGAFAPGQVYVALSRCTTLEGIILRQRLRYRDIFVDERIVHFSRGLG